MPTCTHASLSDKRDVCVLSNGSYTVMLSHSGSGFSRWRDFAVTRWREDPTQDDWGSYLLLRDERTQSTWSVTQQPSGCANGLEVTFTDGRASFVSCHDAFRATLEVAVAPDADIELRRLTLENHGDEARTLSLTSYAELVIGPPGADDAHPAFSKMFVETDWDPESGLLLATRRRSGPDGPAIWAAHAIQPEGDVGHADISFETDRMSFLGRCRDLRNARALRSSAALSNRKGNVLDPVFSMRKPITLAPGARARFLAWTSAADSREGALDVAARMRNPHSADEVFAGAAERARSEYARLGIDAVQMRRFQRWLSAILFADSRQRAPAEALMRGRGGPPVLWAVGVSCDRPIVLLRIDDTSSMPDVHDVLTAQMLWRRQRIAVDIVLLDAAEGSAADALHGVLHDEVKRFSERLPAVAGMVKTEVFVLRNDAIDDGVRTGLLTVARVVLGNVETPAVPIGSSRGPADISQTRLPLRAIKPASAPATDVDAGLEFPNGIGGFCDNGRAYRIDSSGETPAPWSNVMANPAFGTLVTAEGGGYTWSGNSQKNTLTPWPNDPVSDAPHEVLYLRDEESADVWSATALPIRVATARYSTVHAKGWSRFHADAHGIESELTVCVPTEGTLKISRLRLRNLSRRTRHLSVTAYVEWSLGANGTVPAPFVVTSPDAETGALFARNAWRPHYDGRVAFADLCGLQQSMTGARRDFLGSLGTLDSPLALQDTTALSGRYGAGLDPCAALQTRIELPPDTAMDLVFLLGDAASENDARALVARYRAANVDTVLAAISAQWSGLLDVLQVHTPNRAMDILLNDWLLYQVTSCRLWGRTAYYQASGAYGFRDQLQDVMALCVARPDLAREHLVRASGRQFREGDVQHWWLPPSGQGIRTKVSDDRVWLALVAAHYVRVTGDEAVLDIAVPYLAGPAIAEGRVDAFFEPTASTDVASVYEHCALALDSALTRGAHGLPLIGTGDWNDGMNAVGEKGRGESTWLGWFLIATISEFAPLAERRGDSNRVARWRAYADGARAALEEAWDGEWYRRGYYDDGAPLGSRVSDECRIDTIAQSWSVLARAANAQHAAQAMESVDRLLVDRSSRIARLFTPPFDHSVENPGYIKAYPPGVRENGCQYTHGAIWTIFAWSLLGDGERAHGLFDLLNPIHHGEDREAVERYKVEPYVVCADVYSVEPLVGHGGWTWYTGSAGWLYRAGIEAVLGFHLCGDRLEIDPCIPKSWPGFELTYRRTDPRGVVTCYEISVENPEHVCSGVKMMQIDDADIVPDRIVVPLADDGRTHRLRFVLG